MGATSEVFEARRLIDDKSVALKIFSPVFLTDPESLERLRHEVEALEQIQHPNIVQLLSQIQQAHLYALELELVRGQDLRHWAKQYKLGLLEPPVWILAHVARGLGAAHELGILHRDLKPENILVGDDGQVKVMDFGLARSISRMTMTRMGLLIGSMGYMAPEVINGQRALPASDVFSFGVLAYELLAGQPPFSGETPQALVKTISEGIFRPLAALVPHLAPELSQLIDQCLATNPEHRPESIWLVEAALFTALAKSELLTLCRGLVSQTVSPPVAAQALGRKHEILRGKLESARQGLLAKGGLAQRQNLLCVVRETRALFPDDASVEELLPLLAAARPARRKRIVAGLIVLLLLAAGVWVLRENALPTPAPESLPQPAAVTLPEPPLPSERPPRPPSQRRRVSDEGRLHFDVEEGVAVYVDDIQVPTEMLAAFPMSAGQHIVKLVKQGFIPIENRVFVRRGQETMVRARGDSKP